MGIWATVVSCADEFFSCYRLRRGTLPTPGRETSRLFGGVEKPTTTLAHMLASLILRAEFDPKATELTVTSNGEKITIGWSRQGVGYRGYSFKVLQEACDSFAKLSGNTKGYWEPVDIHEYGALKKHVDEYLDSVSIRISLFDNLFRKTPQLGPEVVLMGWTIPVNFSETEKKILTEAILKSVNINRDRLKNKEYYDNQQKAVDAIAKFMGVQPEGGNNDV